MSIGAVSFLHRFGSSLNTHFHYHLLVLDGVFSEGADGTVRFHEASALTQEHWQGLQATVQRRVLRYFHRHNLLDEDVTTEMLSWEGTGGFSIDASVRVEGSDRQGIERLVRYCARPPFSLERLHAADGHASLSSPKARLLYRLPGPLPDERTVLVLTPLELLERLAQFVPPPRMHRHRYHGVLAPNARLRRQVTAFGRLDPNEPDPREKPAKPQPGPGSLGPELSLPDSEPPQSRPARILWAQLLARIYDILPLLCPGCGGELRILAFLTDPPTVRAILRHLELPHRPPPLAPARAPPQGEFPFDQTLGVDPAEPEPIPEFSFDQSLPDELPPLRSGEPPGYLPGSSSGFQPGGFDE